MDEVCPICKHQFNDCQCRFSGSSHTDKSKEIEVVKDHLYLLSALQLSHLIQLEKQWQISYDDMEKNKILEKLIYF